MWYKSEMDFETYYVAAPQEHIQRERKKARELRQSRWWQSELQRGICYYCEQKFPQAELTMDHKVPLARGGQTSKSNVVLACKDCNTKKKHLTPAEQVFASEELGGIGSSPRPIGQSESSE